MASHSIFPSGWVFHSGSRPLNSLISCRGHLGLIEEAQGFIATHSRMGPALRLSVLRQHIPAKFASRDILLEGMRKAGVPE